MLVLKKLELIQKTIEKHNSIEYRIINNTNSKNLILLSKSEPSLVAALQASFDKYIQDIIIESDADEFIINEIKKICPKNEVVHRNVSYINWNRQSETTKFDNVIAGYSFKGGMGRSSTLAYLAYFYYLMGKKIVVLDCDFEAPGIASMFFDREEREKKAGVLDYLIDLNIENELKLDDYFLQSEVSDNSGNFYLFPSGIDHDIKNYINKISKIDFNSKQYTTNYNKLLNHINTTLKPDLILIDLRAGLNESNGLILKKISNSNLLFFNSEEQNEDGLNVILNLLGSMDNNYVMNSTIRFSNSELRNSKAKELNNFLHQNFNTLKPDNIIPVPFHSVMLENNILELKRFLTTEYEIYNTTGNIHLPKLIKTISNRYKLEKPKSSLNVGPINELQLKSILTKLESVFSKLTGTEQFKNENDSKYFYLKEDLTKIVNEQIFLILGAKGSGKSTLFEMFTRPHQAILSKLNTTNNTYIAGLSKNIMADITQDHISLIYKNSNQQTSDIKRFWKCLTLFQLENKLNISDKYFDCFDDLNSKFHNLEVGIEVDRKLKEINIEQLKKDKVITLVYDELDVAFSDSDLDLRKTFITALVSFWQDNIYKFSQIRSKVLLRNDIFQTLEIENKTHLDLNRYELKWNEKEILSLILNIFISALTLDELDAINLSSIIKKKNSKSNEVSDDIDEIRSAIYLIFDRKLSGNRPSMDKFIMTRLADAQGLITPRVIYKFMSESIGHEIKLTSRIEKNHLFTSFEKKNIEILREVSKHKLEEYKAEYPTYKKIYEKLQQIGQRTFSFEELKLQYAKKTSIEKINEDINKLINSGFIHIHDERQKKYQVAYVYLFALNLKLNRSNTDKKVKNNS